jgi:hypothetical protein
MSTATRRTFLASVALGSAVLLAGCGRDRDDGSDDVLDEIGDSLEPEREYVEEPADAPPAPR